MTIELNNNTLGWAARWIEDSLKGETNERVVQFGKNMAMTLRAAQVDTRARVDGVVATVGNAREHWLKLLANAITTAEPTLFPEKGTDIQYVISREAWDGLREIHGELAKSLYAAPAPVAAPVERDNEPC